MNNGHVCLTPACRYAETWTGEESCASGCCPDQIRPRKAILKMSLWTEYKYQRRVKRHGSHGALSLISPYFLLVFEKPVALEFNSFFFRLLLWKFFLSLFSAKPYNACRIHLHLYTLVISCFNDFSGVSLRFRSHREWCLNVKVKKSCNSELLITVIT